MTTTYFYTKGSENKPKFKVQRQPELYMNRIRERMSGEESVIFFANIACITHARKKSLNLHSTYPKNILKQAKRVFGL